MLSASPSNSSWSRASCRSPQVLCVSGAPDQVSDSEVPIPCLHVDSPPLPVLLLLPRLPTVMMKFPFYVSYIVLLWFHVMVMMQFLLSAPAFLAFASPLPLLVFALNLSFALNLPRRLEAAADVLSDMVHADLLLLGVCISRTFHALNVRYSSLSLERFFAQPQCRLGGRRTFTNHRRQYVFDSRRTVSTRVHRSHFSAPLDSPI
jgi:hypothetical protein